MNCGCHEEACGAAGAPLHELIKPLVQSNSGAILIIGDGDRKGMMMSIFNYMTDHGALEDESISIVARPGLYDVPASYISPCGRGTRMLTDALQYALMSDKEDILLDLDDSATPDLLNRAIRAALAGNRIWMSLNCLNEQSLAGLLSPIGLPPEIYGEALIGVVIIHSGIRVKGIDDLLLILGKIEKSEGGL